MTRRSPIYNQAARLAAECAEGYHLYLEAWHTEAHAALNGHLVNAKGRARKVRGEDLLSGPGHPARRAAYASDELREYIEHHPLLSRTEYERWWLTGRMTG